ncbi:MAG: hypothetical protein LUM44_18375 [Pyrinomonadaceae bacterium]|nr:hypothetical protein [Pyrinomonadaceae bacterium]
MSEQGHAKNLELFKKEHHFAVSWGAKYAPTNELLALNAMLAQITAGENILSEIIASRTPYRNATAAAQDAFERLGPLMPRIINAMKGAGIEASVIEDTKTYTRKISGQRKTKKPKDDPNSPDFDESEKANSAAQMSRANRIENFEAVISALEAQAAYKPNEDDLKIITLREFLTELRQKNEAVQDTFITLSNKRAERDALFYTPGTGIVAVGNLFKRYVESFGRNSAEWKQIKDFEFVRIGRR